MRTLIIGSGFVGRGVAARIAGAGGDAVLASRRPPGGHDALTWTELDVTDPHACASVLRETSPDSIVLVHGPSDVTWCDEHPQEAMAGHVDAARNIARLAADRRLLLVSTDNVFDGTADACDEMATTAPTNAYGRAKLAAERVFTEAADATILRVSLIYGWEPAQSAKWLNFFSSCAHRLRDGEQVTAPFDQWTTPILVADVADVVAAVLGASAIPLLHLGGPDRVSRAEWARIIAEEMGADPGLVVAQPRSAGRYAGRPRNSCLTSVVLHREPATAGLRLHGVRDAARLLLTGAGAGHPA